MCSILIFQESSVPCISDLDYQISHTQRKLSGIKVCQVTSTGIKKMKAQDEATPLILTFEKKFSLARLPRIPGGRCMTSPKGYIVRGRGEGRPPQGRPYTRAVVKVEVRHAEGEGNKCIS